MTKNCVYFQKTQEIFGIFIKGGYLLKNSKKLIALLAVPLLLVGCGTSEETASSSENTAISASSTSDEVSTSFVDPNKVVVLPEVVRGYRYDLGEIDTPYAGDTAEFYSIIESQTYENKWFLTYEVYYPKFSTSEISGDGVSTIQAYYEEKAEEENTKMKDYYSRYGFVKKEELIDTPPAENNYYYQDYNYQVVGDYLVVNYDSFSYDGGNHGVEGLATDNFDLRTGNLLTMEDLFGSTNDYADTLNPLLNAALNQAYPDDYYKLDVADLKDSSGVAFEMNWVLTPEGVKFTMNPSVYAASSTGLVEVTIPYDSLQSILKLDGTLS